MADVVDQSLPGSTASRPAPVLDEADSFQYGEVAIPDEEDLEDDISEDFDLAMQKLLESNMADSQPVEPDPSIERHPEVVDDFIRNFLIKMGMHKSLDSFETEWYELKRAGKLAAAASDRVPDAHRHNAQLSDEIIMLRRRLDKANSVAEKASSTWDTFRKERDFHRMHHKRVMQEKNKLIKDIKQLKAHYEKYEPTIAALKRKYESATREKSLASIERDRLAQALKSLQARLADQEDKVGDTIKASPEQAGKASTARGAPPAAPAPARIEPETATVTAPVGAPARLTSQKAPHRSIHGLLAAGPRRNPFADLQFEPMDCAGMQVSKAVKAHPMGIAHIALHPRKPIVATASDDCTWRMWQLPDAELIMAGEGHKDWVAGLEFHPGGACLATGGGDATVKLWDFAEQRCAATLSEHTGAVWAVAFHDAGEVLASCSLDQTIRLWDVAAAAQTTALRGHVDSVNEVQWLMSTNTLASASSDKTLSLWDARSGLPTATLYGHGNSVASVTASLDGRRLVSVDADGLLKAWEVRMLAESANVAVSSSPLNRVRLDRSARVAVVACDDGQVYAVDVEAQQVQGELAGHEESVQSVALDPEGGFVLSAGSDCSFIMWN